MGTEESGSRIGDVLVGATLVDCLPPAGADVAVPLPAAPDRSPVQTAREATVEQTGADPPPRLTADAFPAEVAHG